MVSKKVTQPEVPAGGAARRPPVAARRLPGGRTAISSPRGGRPRSHSLAPAHVGERGAVALLVMAIIGVALVIAGLAVVVQGMTVGTSFAGSPPPNVSQLGIPQILGGIGVMIAGAAETVASVMLLLNRRASRGVAVIVNVVVGVLSLAGAALIFTVGGRDVVLTIALALVGVLLLAAAVVIARRR